MFGPLLSNLKEVNLHKSHFWKKTFSGSRHILNLKKLFFSAIKHDPCNSWWPKRIE